MKAILVFLLVASAFGVVLCNRNISFIDLPALGLLSINAYSIGHDHVDLLRFVMFHSDVKFAHFGASRVGNAGNWSDVTEAAFAMGLRFEALVEYQETNGIDGFQHGGSNGDAVLSTYPLFAGVDWSLTTSSSTDPNTPGVTVRSATMSTSDGVFSYTVSYSGQPRSLETAAGTVLLDQNAFKIAWTINYYESSDASSNNASQIALVLATGAIGESSSKFRLPNSTLPFSHGVNYGATGYAGYVNFENSADVDIQAVTVSHGVNFQHIPNYPFFNPLEANFEYGWVVDGVILSYSNVTRPDSITHDPQMGSSIPDSSASMASVSVISLVLLCTLLAFL